MEAFSLYKSILQIVLILLNLPGIYSLIKRLSDYKIGYKKGVVTDAGSKKYGVECQETKFFFQNQQEFPIDGPIDISIEASAGSWMEFYEGKEEPKTKYPSVNIIHGPLRKSQDVHASKSEEPDIQFETVGNRSHCNITIQGIRPLATFLIICRTNVLAINDVKLRKEKLVENKSVIFRETKSESKDFKEEFLQILRSLFTLVFLFLVCISLPIISESTEEGFWAILLDLIKEIPVALTTDNGFSAVLNISFLVISVMFGLIAVIICRPISPKIIMGYIDETDEKIATGKSPADIKDENRVLWIDPNTQEPDGRKSNS